MNNYFEIIKILISAITPFVALYTAIKVVDRKEAIKTKRKNISFCLDFIFLYNKTLESHSLFGYTKFVEYYISNLENIPYFVQEDFINLMDFYNENRLVLNVSHAKYCNEFTNGEFNPELYDKASEEYNDIEHKFYERIHNIYKKIEKYRKETIEKLNY
ncbi:hypothetical protein HMPREF9126_1386 [Parvimonas sp. oral taxon 110 str. F0139]|nr:hypothetical protein HMPREF9126_1386 [Parvimonas sp. oral taxon 110 str. F0139]